LEFPIAIIATCIIYLCDIRQAWHGIKIYETAIRTLNYIE
jgi:hypothetical protein